ncbi:MAG: response regulator transcription factor [Anaerolineae bacterium]|nr:response regulator transcription factor [Anaerolineae bacterium]
MSKPLAFIIEDHLDAATIFSEALKAADFETEIIRSGDAALERLANTVPDMVILDLNLPQVSGAEILARIRADTRLVKTNVIVATAHPQLADNVQGEADLVLLKPISFTQLRSLATRLSTPDSPTAD